MIVESPAKAKTIAGYLGDDFVVESSIGHIRDLPERAAEIPERYKGQSWADVAEARGRLGYETTVSLEDGLRRTIDALLG